jgi:hypothetical protein
MSPLVETQNAEILFPVNLRTGGARIHGGVDFKFHLKRHRGNSVLFLQDVIFCCNTFDRQTEGHWL